MIREPKRVFPRKLEYGLFYWRVVAISSDGLAGRYSEIGFFSVLHADAPPFLIVAAPKEGAVLSESTVLVSGNTERDVELAVKS